MKYSKKEFLEWKIDFLEEQLELTNMILDEEENLDTDERGSLEKEVKNIKSWLKKLKGKNGEEKETELLEWKKGFLRQQLDNVHLNLEFSGKTDPLYREYLHETGRNIKRWIDEFEKI